MQELIDAFSCKNPNKVLYMKNAGGSQNLVYKVYTNNGIYILKRYYFQDEETLIERKEQLKISKIWSDNGIPCVQPLTDIYSYKNHYYIIYPFIEGNNYDEGQLNKEQIIIVSRLQAKMHLLNVQSFLPINNRKIDVYDSTLNDFIINCNNSIDSISSSLCACNCDYKPLNIIWNGNEPFIIDFDAIYNNNPSFSLLESAYTFCHKNEVLDLDLFKTYILEYSKEYGKTIQNYIPAIYGSWSGKLSWLNHMIKNMPNDGGIINLKRQMISYQNYIEDIKKIIEEINIQNAD